MNSRMKPTPPRRKWLRHSARTQVVSGKPSKATLFLRKTTSPKKHQCPRDAEISVVVIPKRQRPLGLEITGSSSVRTWSVQTTNVCSWLCKKEVDELDVTANTAKSAAAVVVDTNSKTSKRTSNSTLTFWMILPGNPSSAGTTIAVGPKRQVGPKLRSASRSGSTSQCKSYFRWTTRIYDGLEELLGELQWPAHESDGSGPTASEGLKRKTETATAYNKQRVTERETVGTEAQCTVKPSRLMPTAWTGVGARRRSPARGHYPVALFHCRYAANSCSGRTVDWCAQGVFEKDRPY